MNRGHSEFSVVYLLPLVVVRLLKVVKFTASAARNSCAETKQAQL